MYKVLFVSALQDHLVHLSLKAQNITIKQAINCYVLTARRIDLQIIEVIVQVFGILLTATK